MRPAPRSIATSVPVNRRRMLAVAAGLALAARPRGGARAGNLIGAPACVVLDSGLCQMLLALSHTPLAMPNLDFYRKFVIEPTLPDGIVDLGLRSEPNLEVIAELKPDIVFFSPEFGAFRWLGLKTDAVQLPIYDGGRCYPNALVAFKMIAARIGASVQADAYLKRLQGVVDACAVAAAGLKAKKVCVFSFIGAGAVRVYTDTGLFGAALDLASIPNAIHAPANLWGFTDISAEAFASVECQWAIHIGPLPAASTTSPVWQAMPVVRAGRVRTVPVIWMFGGLPSIERFLRALPEALSGGGAHG